MTRRLGVFVAMLACVSSAAVARPKHTAKRHTPASTKAKPPAADPAAPGDADAGSAAGDPAAPDADPFAGIPHIVGPKQVDLGNSIQIDLPAGAVLFEKTEAQMLLKKAGNTGVGVIGAVLKPDADWAIVIHYDDVGYVTDTDADKLDASELLDSYRKGTESQNPHRKQIGVPELYVDRWSEKPHYVPLQHHLLWGLEMHTSDNKKVINYFTRTLGRNGFLSINLIDKPETIAQSKVDAAPIVAAIMFTKGARYQDHASGDKDSGMGLRALVLGGAGLAVLKVAKAGFLIKLLLIFKKGFLILVVGVGAFFKKIFGRGKKQQPDATPPGDGSGDGTPPPGGDGTPPPSVG